MKKFLLSVVCLSVISSVVSAGRFDRVLLLAGERFSEMTKRSMSTVVRSTPGFRPEKQPSFSMKEVNMPTRVRFLDEGHELYVPLDKKLLKERNLRIPHTTREKSNIHVELKKK
ncbi:MAG: hypothetical protein B7Y25_05890 [Alphaproteobacteria bacterium 16-39-46]|nr:MAG: hypothetical protein B7Y25_05890 [Alphaproteobacteria bacterium 16-39-46]OZA42456.1 MAG: hypothetical protein B7X84_05950 [Alphaproteobacteria bacterium 17-39-52]HQS83535.1 hypothetical protein [Alphaproteobacteria bacterium]HQS93314.1 hypothetical protein [Alphaproteobacteria bacterium]